MSPLEELIMKKLQAGEKMDPMQQKAKLASLDALKGEMHGMMKDHLLPRDGAKVEVEASSPVGLKEGLEVAQEVLPEGVEAVGEEETAGPEVSVEAEDNPGLSDEEMAQLKLLLAKMKQ